MGNVDKNRKKVEMLIVLISAVVWPMMFRGTVSYETTFIFLSIVSFILYILMKKNEGVIKADCCSLLLAFFISFAFVLADYSIFITGKMIDLLRSIVGVLCGTVIFYILVSCFEHGVLNCKRIICSSYKSKVKRKIVLLAFSVPVIIDFAYLFLVSYPGWIPRDGANQIAQMMVGTYGNHHPFWHTKTMEMIIKPVYILTGDGNAAVATFSVFQILVMSSVFAYMVSTLCDLKLNKYIIYAVIIIHSIMPENIAMSCSIIKDAAFAIMVTLCITATSRVFYNLGKRHIIDYVLLVLGTSGSCLYRTNGMYASVLLSVFILFVMWKKWRGIAVSFCITVLICLFLNNVMIDYWNISQPDTVESLSVPLQQIARCSYDKKEIGSDNEEFINMFSNYEQMGLVYNPIGADNEKNYIRKEGNQAYLTENKGAFWKMWVNIGIHHPFNYVKAWVDETRGYWSGSYYYSTWRSGVSDVVDLSRYNIYRVDKKGAAAKVWNVWDSAITHNVIPFVEVYMSVGIRFWGLICCCYIAIKHRRISFVFSLLPLFIVLTLAIATPLNSEFRYAYSIFFSFAISLTSVIKCFEDDFIGLKGTINEIKTDK